MGKAYLTFLMIVSILLGSGSDWAIAGPGFDPSRVNIGAGAVWPQGSFGDFVDPGVNITGRITQDFGSLFNVWGGLNYTIYSNKNSLVKAGEYYDGAVPVSQEVSQQGLAFHLGFGLGYNKGLVRPRADRHYIHRSILFMA
jgi:hypothetical protein